MTLDLILVVCLCGTTFAYHNHGGSGIGGSFGGGGASGSWGGGMVVSRRDASADTASIYQLVRDTLDSARQTITAADLGDAALSIQTSADAYIDANGGEVPAQEVQDLIDDIAAKFNGAVAISALFDTPLIYEGYLLDAALCLLNGLVEKAEELEAAGSSPNPAIAGISMTAMSIQAIVADTVGYVTYMAEKETEKEQPAKRWEFNGGINHGPGGTSYSVGLSHKWGQRRLVRSAVNKNRRGCDDDDKDSDSQGGGFSIGGSISYTFGR